ncbi:hypothetical protein WDU94_009170, partial [Cyamophila willieti]
FLFQFLCIRNIKTFIQVCRNYFDIAEHDLFEPSMLFDFGDFFKVLHTLSKLSQCPKVLRTRNLKGFSINPPRTLSQENIYKSLNTNIGFVEPKWMQFTIKSPQVGDSDETVYEDLCYVKIPMQLSAVATEKRDYVINELIETEKNYVNVLATLYRCFMKPLCKMMKLEDFNIVFSGIKELNEIHRDFHSDLRKAVSIPNSPIKLSDVFLKYKERFLIYGDYCANLTIAQHRIEELCNKNEPFRQEVVKCQEEANNDKFKLRDILSVPMQRILKYHLLLENLIAKTSENHDDYRGLVRAKEGMVDVAQYINEVKRDSDTLQIMREIQFQISDMGMRISPDLKQYGKLLYDGDIRVKSHVDQKVKSRYIFIFDLVILMCKTVRNEKSYSFKEILYLKEYRLEDNTSKRVMPRDARWTFQWSLISKTGNSPNYTLSARIETLKQKCVKAIQDALDNIEPSALRSTDHKFQMHSFDRAPYLYPLL